MNRKILVRGKRIGTKEWVVGSYIYAHKWNWDGSAGHLICDIYGTTKTQVIPETVGQFTGLTDKNGKKIFEGDILKAWYSSVEIEGFFENLEVYYDDSYAQYRAGYKDLYEVAENSEVVGNIHDNPELLQEK